jgi:hypothetical protein
MPITWPADLVPNSLSFWLQPNASALESPINRARQVLARDGTRWMAELDFVNLDPIKAGRVHALVARMKGGAETVTVRSEPQATTETRRLTRTEWRAFLATLNGDGTDLDADRVNELLIAHGYAQVPTSTARDWAGDAPDRAEGGT